MCSYNLTAIQPKSHESRYSNVQDDNLKHEFTHQIKSSSLYLVRNYTFRCLFCRLQVVSMNTDLLPRKLIGIWNLYTVWDENFKFYGFMVVGGTVN